MTMLERASLNHYNTEPVNQENEQNYEATHERLMAEIGARAMANYQPLLRELSPEEEAKMQEEMRLIDSPHWREHIERKYGVSTWQQVEAETLRPSDY